MRVSDLRLSLLPGGPSDLKQLRAAFTSHDTDGHWMTPPKDTELRRLLRRQGLLQGDQEQEVLEAMRRYARAEGLPERRSQIGRSTS